MRTLWLTCPRCGRNLARVTRGPGAGPARRVVGADVLDIAAAGTGTVREWRAVEDPRFRDVPEDVMVRDLAATCLGVTWPDNDPPDRGTQSLLRARLALVRALSFTCTGRAGTASRGPIGCGVEVRRTDAWLWRAWLEEAEAGEGSRHRSLHDDPSPPSGSVTD